MNVPERISALRALMAEKGYDAYVVPTDDNHQSEYVGEHFKARAFITGFTGSAGTAIITKDEAGLWTDGRYFIQAEQQLSGSGIKLFKMGEPGVPTTLEYLENTLPEGCALAFDGRVVAMGTGLEFEEIAKKKNGQIHYTDKRDIVFESSPPKWYCNDIPMISILNSFLPELRDGTVMSIADADKCFKSIHEHMNKTNVENRTDARITFSVSYARGSIKETATIPENYAMDLCREARIPQHIAHLASLGVIEDPGLPAFLSKHLGLSLIEEKVAKEVIPSIEKEAERKDYTSYIRTYIKSSRRLLNQHHDIDIAAPLGVRNYRTDKSMRTTRREKKEAAATDDESKSKRRENTRTRTRQDKRKRRLR